MTQSNRLSIRLSSGGTNQKHLVDAATRNLGLHYLSEGRVEDARPLLRKCLEAYEETVRSDMAGGDESLELIPPLTVLSYADMLAGMNDADPFKVGGTQHVHQINALFHTSKALVATALSYGTYSMIFML